MEQSSDNESVTARLPTEAAADQSESRRLKRLRLRQMRRDSRSRATQTQKAAAETIERFGRYMLWTVIAAAILATVAAAAVGYTIFIDLTYPAPH
jgi:predicted lysophospholipase L1 biosynthesis ABC-type transport system permease subunit